MQTNLLEHARRIAMDPRNGDTPNSSAPEPETAARGAPANAGNSPEPIMQFFAYDHLPPQLAGVSQRFAELADYIVAELPRNAERTVALRKVLEAKDAAVRARLAR